MKNSRTRKIRPHTITSRMILYTSSILVVLSVLLCGIFWALASSSFRALERRLMENQIRSAQTQIRYTLNSAQSVTAQLVQLPSLRAAGASHASEASWQESDQDVAQIAQNAISANTNATGGMVTFLNVYMKNGYHCVSNPGDTLPFSDYESCVAYLASCTGSSLEGYVSTTWAGVVSSHLHRQQVASLVGMRFLYDRVTMEKIGVIAIGLRISSIQSILTAISTDAFLLRADGTILTSASLSASAELVNEAFLTSFHSLSSGSGEGILSDGRTAGLRRIGTGPLWAVYPLTESVSSQDSVSRQFFLLSILLSVLAAAAAIVLSRFYARRMTRSLNELTDVVRQVQAGSETARFHSSTEDDIAYLGGQVNAMLDQMEASFAREKEEDQIRRSLELQLMQKQINPHLLYNTLNSVLWIIRQNDREKAEKLILSLGSFFKLVLSKGNEMIPLSDELSMIRYYLQIQNLGRSKSFQLKEDVPDALRDCLLFRLTLQPFVENAVIHGFSDWREDGTILIIARQEGETDLLLTVTDNGIGILPEDLADILEELKVYPPPQGSRHFGMYNVQRRIQDKFGADYGISMESEVGEYTRVRIRIPRIAQAASPS